MKLVDFLMNHVIAGSNLLVYMTLDVGTKESFTVEIMRGMRNHSWRQEYWDWLKALDLEIESVDALDEDCDRHKHLLCIKCKPKKIAA